MTHETAAGAAQETKSPISGFLSEFKDFQTEIKSRMNEQDQKIGQMGRKSAHRPALEGASAAEAPHQKAMNAYLRAGDDAARVEDHNPVGRV